MNKYFLFLASGFLIVFIVIIIIIINSKPEARTQEQNPATVTPRQEQTNTKSATKTIHVAEIYPSADKLQKLSVVSPITVAFDKPVDPESIIYNISPKIEVDVELDSSGTKLTFKPSLFWEPGIPYSLSFLKVRNKTGAEMINEYNISFRALNTNDNQNKNSAESTNNP